MNDAAVTVWLERNAHDILTLDPDETDTRDLEWLRTLVEGKKVVAIGESMHRIHEFYQFRHRVIRFLVRELGFTVVAMESGIAEGAAVDAYVRGERTDIRIVLSTGVTYHMGKCQEMLDQIAWMREYNLSAVRPVRFFGIDIPDSSASARPAVIACLAFLKQVDPPYADVVRSTLLPLFDYLPEDREGLAWVAPAIQSYLALDAQRRFELTAGLNALVERMMAMSVTYVSAARDAENFHFALRCAATARHADAFLAAMVTAPGRAYAPANIRDYAMAENVRSLVERGERVIVIAANGHVQCWPFHAPPFVPTGMTTMGEHLRMTLREDMLVIGAAYGGGEAWLHRPGLDSEPGQSLPFVEELPSPDSDTLDGVLAMRAGMYAIELNSANGSEALESLAAVTGSMQGPHVQLLDPRAAYDIAYVIPVLSPWHTWIDELGHS